MKLGSVKVKFGSKKFRQSETRLRQSETRLRQSGSGSLSKEKLMKLKGKLSTKLSVKLRPVWRKSVKLRPVWRKSVKLGPVWRSSVKVKLGVRLLRQSETRFQKVPSKCKLDRQSATRLPQSLSGRQSLEKIMKLGGKCSAIFTAFLFAR